MTISTRTKWVNTPANGVKTSFTRRHPHNARDKRADIANRLLPAMVETISCEPVKILARDSGIAPDTLKERKRGASLLDGPGLIRLAQVRPNSPLAHEMRSLLMITGTLGTDDDHAVVTEVTKTIVR